jgi:hypothetical protein
MAITHNFVSSNSVGGIGEAIFYLMLSTLGEVQSVAKDRKWQKLGVDFILGDVYYDTKFDTKAFSTGNIALETVSRQKNGEVLKSGWAHTSQADCIVYIYLENTNWSMYFFTPEEVKSIVNRDYETKTIQNYGYESEVVLLPLSELSHKLKITFPVVGGFEDTELLKKVHTYLKEKKNV